MTPTKSPPRQHARYLHTEHASLYTVLHEPQEDVRGSILMLGPFGLERTHAYLAWVRVARKLARAGFEVLRFDYRGNGESSGDFERVTFDAWREDAEHCLGLLGKKPITLLGLRVGALIAASLGRTHGDGLVLWEPPRSGRAHLLDILRRKLASDYAENAVALRKTREDYVRELEAGSVVEVEGHPWTRAFWESAQHFDLVLPAGKPTRTISTDGRGDVTVKIPKPPFWLDSMVLDPDISPMIDATMEMLAADDTELAAQ